VTREGTYLKITHKNSYKRSTIKNNSIFSEVRKDDHLKKGINKFQDHKTPNWECSKDCIKPRGKNVIEIKMEF
jgi:hypothetical protein